MLKNYRPVSLLTICGKTFEPPMYNVMWEFLSDNNLLSPNKSWFRSCDSCIKQLRSIHHEVLNKFDKGPEVRGIFCDISNAFDRIWHDGLIFKLHQNGISGGIINILRELLHKMKQRVILSGQCSSWDDIRIILGPLLFLVYIKSLTDGEYKLFVDDTSLFSLFCDINTSTSDLNEDLEKIGNWNFKWKMNLNPYPNKQA